MKDRNLLPSISAYVEDIEDSFSGIPEERKKYLRQIAGFISGKITSNQPANLIFICTHNSRRSHMSQIWAQTAAFYYGLTGIHCFSGGTEATAFNPRAVKAMRRAGFEITVTEDGENPVYRVAYANSAPPLQVFSKKYNDSFNPQNDFCAVMTCSAADEACPVVFGASERISIPYEDPKVADDTDYESARYDERAHQIASEIFYLFSQVQR